MKYNLAEQTYLSVTSSGIGNVFINGPDINNLLIDPGTPVVTVSGSNDDILVIDCDLTRRTEVEEVRYYFFSDTASGIVASGIEFQYKNNLPESYTTMPTSTDNGYYYYATIPESPSVPRYLRLTHTLSGTAISGTVNCFYVVNDGSQVDFGTDGSLTQRNIVSSYDTAVTSTIPIYNNGAIKADMYVMIEATGEAIDDLISVSDSESGTYYGPTINADSVAGPSNWDEGIFVNTVIDGGDKLVIDSGNYGTYTTIIKQNIDEIKRYNIVAEMPDDSIITTVSGNAYEVIEVRESGSNPINYAYYSKLVPSGKYIYIDNYWTYDQSFKNRDSAAVHTAPGGGATQHPEEDMYLYVDSTSELKVGAYSHDTVVYGYGSDATVNLFRYTKDDVVTTFVINYSSGFNYAPVTIPYWMETDSAGGVWFYLYSVYYAAGRWVTATGYYLARLDSSMVETMKIYSSTDNYTERAFSVDYSNDRLWIYDSSQALISKLDAVGNVVFSYIAETVYALVDDGDGGLWYVGDLTINHIDSIGDELASFSTGSTIQYTDVKIADDDTLWVISTDYVRNIYKSDGRLNFLINVLNAYKLHSVQSGVYVETTTSKYHYIDKADRKVKFTLDDFTHPHGFMDASVNDDGFKSYFPITVDPIWGSLEWKEVNYYKYMLDASKMYYQLRVTLRSSIDGLTSPEVEHVYIQKGIKLNDVFVQNYRNIYFKLNATTQSNIGSYTPKLLAWREEIV